MQKSAVSDRASKTLDLVQQFVEEECIPGDRLFHAQLGQGEERWKSHPPIVDELKAKAKKLGLWNLFLPKNHFSQGAGFSNVEYGLMAEYMGKSGVASEVPSNQHILFCPHALTSLAAGMQLRRPRHRQHGSSCQVWRRRTKEAMAGSTSEGRDTIRLLDD